MENKYVTVAALAAVLVIGFVGLVNVDSQSGMAMLESRGCHCAYRTTQPGVPGSAMDQGQFITNNLRVYSAEKHTNAGCMDLCSSLAHRGLTVEQAYPIGLGTPFPFTQGQRQRPYQQY